LVSLRGGTSYRAMEARGYHSAYGVETRWLQTRPCGMCAAVEGVCGRPENRW